MVGRHVEDVEDQTDDDHQVKERVRDKGVEPLFAPAPAATTVPLEEDEATWRT